MSGEGYAGDGSRADLDRLRPPTELSAPVVRESSDWQRRLQQELELAMSRRDHDGPLSLPEVLRELDMVTGALAGVEQRAAELVVQLRDVADPELTLRLEKMAAERAAAIREERDSNSVEGTIGWPRTQVGQRLRQLHQPLAELEEALAVTRHSVQL